MGFTYIHNPATLCDADIKLVGDFMEMRDSFDVVVGGKSITSGLLQHATKICEMHLRQEKFQNELTKREFERIYKELKLEADAEIHAEPRFMPNNRTYRPITMIGQTRWRSYGMENSMNSDSN